MKTKLFVLGLILSFAGGTLVAQEAPVDPPVAESDVFDPPLSDSIWDGFDLKVAAVRTHRALGYIAPTLGLATYLSMGDDDGGGGHQTLGTAAAWTAGANLVLGLVTHWDQLSFVQQSDDWLTRDNLHAVIAAAGAISMVAAGLTGGSDGHALWGELGTILMGTAIVFEL